MRALPIKWYDIQYKVPRGETIVVRACSKEGGPVDYIITKVERGPESIYKLYAVIFESLIPAVPHNVKLIKVSKDPTVLQDMIFGK